MAIYQKLPRSRLKSNMDGEDTIIPYRNASPKAKASAAPYSPPPSARKGSRLDSKAPAKLPARPVSKTPAPRAPDASLTKSGRSSTPPMKKGSTQPQAYTGEQGDIKKSKGAVTSYQKNGYTYTKNAKGNFQNFTASKTPYKLKGK